MDHFEKKKRKQQRRNENTLMSEEAKMHHADELSYKVLKKMEVREKKT